MCSSSTCCAAPPPGIEEQAPVLRRQLLAWWKAHGRRNIAQKPWMFTTAGQRPADGEPLDPLKVWVAEVMLQQTRLAVALPYWQRWMTAFPDLPALAAADPQQVLLLWQGLGYYVRARRLQQGARQLLDACAPGADPWPRHLDGWLALSGIGRSTAGSILSSAFDQPIAILDGNAARVLARLIAAPRPPKRDLAGFWRLSELLLDPHRPRAFNQALMDLGATVCTPVLPTAAVVPGETHALLTLPATLPATP